MVISICQQFWWANEKQEKIKRRGKSYVKAQYEISFKKEIRIRKKSCLRAQKEISLRKRLRKDKIPKTV